MVNTEATDSRVILGAQSRPGRFTWPRVFGYDFFISFKLGNPPVGTQSYASDLARRLREEDFTVFFSEEEAPPGAELDTTLIRALHRSSILVVIANQGALSKSQWVRKEVEQFRRKHPKRPVIPINVEHAIEEHGPQVDADKWLGHQGHIWLDEAAQAVNEGIISSEVLRRLLLAPTFIKAKVLFRWLVATIIAVLIGLGSYAWLKKEESHNRFVDYNISQGRVALTSGRALEAAPSLLRAFKEGADTPALRFMLARAFGSIDALIASFDGNALAFSSDGAQFAVALADGTVQLWSLPERKIIATLREKVPGARGVVFAPGGTTLAITAEPGQGTGAAQKAYNNDTECGIGERGGSAVSIWDVQSGALLHKIHSPVNVGDCWKSFFSDNGRKFTIAGWTTQWTDLYWSMTKFDTATYDAVSATYPDNERPCRELAKDVVMKMMNEEGTGSCPGKVVALSSDGALVALAPWGFPQRELSLWDVRQGVEQTLLFGHDTEITGAAFSPDNERIAVAQAEGIDIWDVRARRKLLSISLDAAWLPAEFSPEGSRLVAVTAQRSAAVFDAVDGHRLTLLAGHAARIRVATFSPDGEHILTAGDDGIAKVWDAWNGKLLITLEGHREPIIRATFSPDLRFIVTKDQEGHIKVWNGRPSAMPLILRDDPARVKWWSNDFTFELADWSPDGNKVLLKHRDFWATNDENLFTLLNTRTGISTGLWRTSRQPILRSDKTTVDRADRDATKHAPCPSETNGSEPEEPLALDYAGDRVVVGGGGSASRVAFLQAKAEGCRKIPLEGHRSEIKAAAFSPDDNFVLTADDAGAMMVWDAANASLLAVLAGEERPHQVSFLPGGRAITLHGRNSAVVWNLSLERRPIPELEGILSCSGIVPSDALGDLVRGGVPECAPDIRLPEPMEPTNSFNAARAFLVSGWARRNDRFWAERQLLASSALYHKLRDSFGEAVCHLALRALAISAGDITQAESGAKVVRELMLELNRAEDQQARLTRLGEIAFNEFGDAELARFAFAHVLERAPQDPAAKLGAWETSTLIGRPKDWLKAVSPDDLSNWSGSLRALVIEWVARNLASQKVEDAAFAVWDMYAAGTTINPGFERLDFRGLRHVIAGAKLPKERQQQTLSVLEKLELPGDHGNELKGLLGVLEDRKPIGP